MAIKVHPAITVWAETRLETEAIASICNEALQAHGFANVEMLNNKIETTDNLNKTETLLSLALQGNPKMFEDNVSVTQQPCDEWLANIEKRYAEHIPPPPKSHEEEVQEMVEFLKDMDAEERNDFVQITVRGAILYQEAMRELEKPAE